MFLVELVYHGIFNEFFCYFYVESLVVILRAFQLLFQGLILDKICNTIKQGFDVVKVFRFCLIGSKNRDRAEMTIP